MTRYRQQANDLVLRLGNAALPHLPLIEGLYRRRTRNYHANYGLGSFLTQDVNFAKAGATLGATLLLSATYAFFYASGQNEAGREVVAGLGTAGLAVALPIEAMLLVAMTGLVGRRLGASIDESVARVRNE